MDFVGGYKERGITESVLTYFVRRKFGTVKMCAGELGYSLQQTRSSIKPLKDKNRIRPLIIHGKQRGNGIYMLQGYNAVTGDAKRSRLDALKAAGRMYADRNSRNGSVSSLPVLDFEDGSYETEADVEDRNDLDNTEYDPDNKRIAKEIKILGVDGI